MIVTKTAHGVFRVQLSEDELNHFCTMVVFSENLLICDISSLLNFVLTWCEQHWYEVVEEPTTDGSQTKSS